VGPGDARLLEVVSVPTAIAKKMITFSPVGIPVSVYPATSRHRVPLHMVHDRGTLVPSRQDLEQLPTPDTKEIRVLGFLDESRVDPLHYDKSYCLGVAAPGGERPYVLLRAALAESGQVAVARTALRTRDSLVVLRVRGDAIVMTTLLWPDEVRDTEGIAPKPIELRPDEVALARQLMDTISADFDPEQERDEYTVALREVVEAADLPAGEEVQPFVHVESERAVGVDVRPEQGGQAAPSSSVGFFAQVGSTRIC
jgi:DNA end-binding protein Ku